MHAFCLCRSLRHREIIQCNQNPFTTPVSCSRIFRCAVKLSQLAQADFPAFVNAPQHRWRQLPSLPWKFLLRLAELPCPHSDNVAWNSSHRIDKATASVQKKHHVYSARSNEVVHAPIESRIRTSHAPQVNLIIKSLDRQGLWPYFAKQKVLDWRIY